MSLNDSLKIAMIEDLKQVNILWIDFYARRNKEILNFLYHQGIIDNSSVESALEVAVFNQARRDYTMMIAKERGFFIYADHIVRPDCFAYALEKNLFSKKEIKRITFDNEDVVETYFKTFSKENLLSVIRKELFNPKPLLEFENDYDSYPVCFCGN